MLFRTSCTRFNTVEISWPTSCVFAQNSKLGRTLGRLHPFPLPIAVCSGPYTLKQVAVDLLVQYQQKNTFNMGQKIIDRSEDGTLAGFLPGP